MENWISVEERIPPIYTAQEIERGEFVQVYDPESCPPVYTALRIEAAVPEALAFYAVFQGTIVGVSFSVTHWRPIDKPEVALYPSSFF